jgi:Phosphate-selective porin O and P
MKKTPKRITFLRILLWASAMAFSPSAYSQTLDQNEAEPPADAPSPDDPSVLTVGAAEASTSAGDAKTALLEAQIAGLQAQLDALKAQMTKATPSWKGAPQFNDADEGWSFKVRGRLMLDAAYAGKPDNFVANRNLGFNARIRRFRIGAEGAIPGGFGYKAEVDYANGTVGFGDVILTYAPANKPFAVTLGNHESWNNSPVRAGQASLSVHRSTTPLATRGGLAFRLVSKPKTISSELTQAFSPPTPLTLRLTMMAGLVLSERPMHPMLGPALSIWA